MRYLQNYDNFILEAQQSLETIYTKYYSDIHEDIFYKIVKADPTYKEKTNRQGIYMKWLLNLYINKKLKLEDLYKATEYLTIFNQFKHKLAIKDINSYNNLPELFNAVKPFAVKEDNEFVNEDERKLVGQYKEVFRNDKYRIIIPKTLKASKYFGRGTEWCTTKKDNFDEYTRHQDISKITPLNLYILYTENSDDRLQFHFEAQQFMDISDKDIDIKTFWSENPDIALFFKDVISNIFLNVDPYEHMMLCADYLGYSYAGYDKLNEINELDCDIIDLDYGSMPYDDTYIFGSLFLVDKKIDISVFQKTFKEMLDMYDISEYNEDFIVDDEKLEYDKSKKYMLLMYVK